ncbi:hypothetical protein BD779DRAFT_1474429 [Infundibulicybe gibba]|nr:hypothetical protein BD779DRAFT_1474429 [Infundibulicybe gibba]
MAELTGPANHIEDIHLHRQPDGTTNRAGAASETGYGFGSSEHGKLEIQIDEQRFQTPSHRGEQGIKNLVTLKENRLITNLNKSRIDLIRNTTMPKLGQTGPERAAALRQLPTIPNEIFLEIFGYIQPSIEIEPAECKSSPGFPSKLKLDKNDKRTNPPSVAFCRALLRDIFVVERDSVESNGWVGTAFITMCCRALHWIPNVEVLFLLHSKFDSGMWEMVGRCSKLKTLWLFDVSSLDDVPAKEVERITRLRLSNFIILRSQMSTLSRILNPSALSGFSGDPDTLKALLANGSTSKLETLAISRPVEVRALINILSKVPSPRGYTPRIFRATALHTLTCPLPLVMLLAPGRPLTSVGILDVEPALPLNLDTILGSHKPNSTIVELSISLAIDDETPAAGRFPCLRNLVLQNTGRPQAPAPEAAAELKPLVVSSCDKWAGNPSVQQLVIRINSDLLTEYPPVDLTLQHAVLTENLSRTFPALLQFQLGEYAVWERFAVGDAWRVLVSAKDRAKLVARLEAGDPSVVNYDGYLRRSSPHNLL